MNDVYPPKELGAPVPLGDVNDVYPPKELGASVPLGDVPDAPKADFPEEDVDANLRDGFGTATPKTCFGFATTVSNEFKGHEGLFTCGAECCKASETDSLEPTSTIAGKDRGSIGGNSVGQVAILKKIYEVRFWSGFDCVVWEKRVRDD